MGRQGSVATEEDEDPAFSEEPCGVGARKTSRKPAKRPRVAREDGEPERGPSLLTDAKRRKNVKRRDVRSNPGGASAAGADARDELRLGAELLQLLSLGAPGSTAPKKPKEPQKKPKTERGDSSSRHEGAVAEATRAAPRSLDDGGIEKTRALRRGASLEMRFGHDEGLTPEGRTGRRLAKVSRQVIGCWGNLFFPEEKEENQAEEEEEEEEEEFFFDQEEGATAMSAATFGAAAPPIGSARGALRQRADESAAGAGGARPAAALKCKKRLRNPTRPQQHVDTPQQLAHEPFAASALTGTRREEDPSLAPKKKRRPATKLEPLHEEDARMGNTGLEGINCLPKDDQNSLLIAIRENTRDILPLNTKEDLDRAPHHELGVAVVPTPRVRCRRSKKVKESQACRGPRSPASSYRGVTCYKRTGRWEAHIWDSGRQRHLGSFGTAHDAARAYDKVAIKFRGWGSELNFPVSDYYGDPSFMRLLAEKSKGDFVIGQRLVGRRSVDGAHVRQNERLGSATCTGHGATAAQGSAEEVAIESAAAAAGEGVVIGATEAEEDEDCTAKLTGAVDVFSQLPVSTEDGAMGAAVAAGAPTRDHLGLEVKTVSRRGCEMAETERPRSIDGGGSFSGRIANGTEGGVGSNSQVSTRHQKASRGGLGVTKKSTGEFGPSGREGKKWSRKQSKPQRVPGRNEADAPKRDAGMPANGFAHHTRDGAADAFSLRQFCLQDALHSMPDSAKAPSTNQAKMKQEHPSQPQHVLTTLEGTVFDDAAVGRTRRIFESRDSDTPVAAMAAEAATAAAAAAHPSAPPSGSDISGMLSALGVNVEEAQVLALRVLLHAIFVVQTVARQPNPLSNPHVDTGTSVHIPAKPSPTSEVASRVLMPLSHKRQEQIEDKEMQMPVPLRPLPPQSRQMPVPLVPLRPKPTITRILDAPCAFVKAGLCEGSGEKVRSGSEAYESSWSCAGARGSELRRQASDCVTPVCVVPATTRRPDEGLLSTPTTLGYGPVDHDPWMTPTRTSLPANTPLTAHVFGNPSASCGRVRGNVAAKGGIPQETSREGGAEADGGWMHWEDKPRVARGIDNSASTCANNTVSLRSVPPTGITNVVNVKGSPRSDNLNIRPNACRNTSQFKQGTSSSTYKGVTMHRRSRRWESHIWDRGIGRQLYLGGYASEEHAAEAFDIAAIKLKGPTYKGLNFDIARYRHLLPLIKSLPAVNVIVGVRRHKLSSFMSSHDELALQEG